MNNIGITIQHEQQRHNFPNEQHMYNYPT